MPQIRVALCQVDVTVGAVAANTDLILRATRQAAERSAHLVAFGEMTLPGYPVEDLALRRSFQHACRAAVDDLAARLAAEGLGELTVLVGYLDGVADAPDQVGRPAGSPQNAAAVLHDGRVVARYAKHHLPNYGVFDEFRYFVPGRDLPVVQVHGVDVAIAICEDLWQDGGPVAATAQAGAGLLVVLNGSPYEAAKDDFRLDLCRRRAAEARATLAYVNLVGGQDELVFGGDSLVVSADGQVLARAPQFVEHTLLVDLDLPAAAGSAAPGVATEMVVHRHVISSDPLPGWERAAGEVAERIGPEAEVYGALVTALRCYVTKNRFGSVVLGLSGGIDSALTAAIAVDALGAPAVHGVSMPGAYSSAHSLADAAELARRTGLAHREIRIDAMVAAFVEGMGLRGLAEENIQARVRGATLMALSNSEGHLVLATGNKSEIAVGYSTIYGDAVGGFAPIKDVPKTTVWRLARWRNAEATARGEVPPIPANSIDKPPSAELRPGQLDSDTLPDYAVLDDILDDYVEDYRGAADLVAQGFDPALVEHLLRLVDAAEYKRRQYPPGPKISFRAFGRDRRLPVTNAWREVAPADPADPGSTGRGPRAGSQP